MKVLHSNVWLLPYVFNRLLLIEFKFTKKKSLLSLLIIPYVWREKPSAVHFGQIQVHCHGKFPGELLGQRVYTYKAITTQLCSTDSTYIYKSQ